MAKKKTVMMMNVINVNERKKPVLNVMATKWSGRVFVITVKRNNKEKRGKKTFSINNDDRHFIRHDHFLKN